MFKTNMGPIEDAENTVYLRPETAQAMFVDFATIQQVSRKKIPFGIAQIGRVVPQRDHAGELHLPPAGVRADGDGVLRRAGHRRGLARVLDRGADALVDRPRAPRGPPPDPRARRRRALALLEAHGRHRVPVPVHGLGGARGHREPDRLRPEGAPGGLGRGPHVLRPGEERALPPVRDRARGRAWTGRCSRSSWTPTARRRRRPRRAARRSARTSRSTGGWRRRRSPCSRCRATRSSRPRPAACSTS